jgi:GTP-binding protein
MVDATERISQVDKNLSKELQERHAPTVIVVNKWDLVEGRIGRYGRPVDPEDYRKYLEEELVGLSRAPIVFASAKEGRSLKEIVGVAFDLHEQATSRVGTGELNRMMTEILEERGPSSKLGRQAKIYYVSQVAVSPPTIVMVVNQEDLFKPEYRRYLLNRLAERTPFAEVPIRLIIRERKRAEVKELISGDYRKRKQLERELESAGDVETNQPRIALDGSKPIWESMAEHEERKD